MSAVALFLHRAPPSQMEGGKALVAWLLAQGRPSAPGAARAVLLREAPVLAAPQVVLALCLQGEHPTHSRDRQAAVELHGAELIKVGGEGRGGRD